MLRELRPAPHEFCDFNWHKYPKENPICTDGHNCNPIDITYLNPNGISYPLRELRKQQDQEILELRRESEQGGISISKDNHCQGPQEDDIFGCRELSIGGLCLDPQGPENLKCPFCDSDE